MEGFSIEEVTGMRDRLAQTHEVLLKLSMQITREIACAHIQVAMSKEFKRGNGERNRE